MEHDIGFLVSGSGTTVWYSHTFSEHPEGVTVITLLAGVMPSRQAVRLQTLTQ